MLNPDPQQPIPDPQLIKIVILTLLIIVLE